MIQFLSVPRGTVAVGGAIALAAFAQPAGALNFADIDPDNWFGTGANESALVVDFNGIAPDGDVIYGYRYDGAPTGEQMFRDIVAQDPRLVATFSTDFGGSLGFAIYGIGYDFDDDGTPTVDPALTFTDGIATIADFNDTDSSRTAVDPGDLYIEGFIAGGFWSYFVGEPDPVIGIDWEGSGVGFSTRTLSDGSIDGWSWAAGFNATSPSVPEPTGVGLLFGGAAAMMLRRRRKLAGSAAAALALGLVTAPQASAQYVFDADDFAVELVESSGFGTPGTFSDPTSLLGRPTLRFDNDFTGASPDIRRTKIVEPAFNVSPTGDRLITTFNAGASATYRMGRPVTNDPLNPFGIDLLVFGNSFFGLQSGSGPINDSTNLNTTTLSGGIFAENVQVSVSPDNVNWYTFDGQTADGLFPTNAFVWDRATASWSDDELDPTKPVDPTLTAGDFSGISAADALDLYDGSAGGAGFDLAESPFESIEFVRISGISGFSGGEVDAIADVAPIPEPAALGVLGIAGLLLKRRS